MKKKIPKSFDEQLNFLKDPNIRSLLVEPDIDAKCILITMNYYVLKGYALALGCFDNNQNKYTSGSLGEIYSLFLNDIEFKSIIFEGICVFEKSFKSIVACEVSQYMYSLNKIILISKRNKQKWLSIFNPKYTKKLWENTIYPRINKESKQSAIVLHHLKKKGGFPLWVAVEFYTFDSLIKIYFDLNDLLLKHKISQYYKVTSSKLFMHYLLAIKEVRNNIAHHGKFVGSLISKKNRLPIIQNKYFEIKKDQRRTYLNVMLILNYLLMKINPSYQKVFAERIVLFLNNHPVYKQTLKITEEEINKIKNK